jgi:signal transduction histidine kinase/CheY-like chemotaxis protein
MMANAVAVDREHRLLMLAPIGKDAALIGAALAGEAVSSVACRDLAELVGEAELGAAAIVVAEEAVTERDRELAALVKRQPPWSDLPVLVLARTGVDSPIAARTVQMLGNVTLLERPVRVAALVSAVRSALRARERQYQIRALLDERRQAEERKDQFIATLAHELRNPLAPIRNSLALLRLDRTGAGADTNFEILERQVNHLVRLVDDLMDIERITRGKIEIRKEPVAAAAVVAIAVETSRPLIDGAGHELVVSLPEEELLLDADPVRVAQVFSNLLNNAAKYTNRGGRIMIAARREERTAVVTVSDTGVGIAPGSLSRVFEMFAQADTARHGEQTGLGIGLSLARGLVELHGGSLTARSEGPGRGSTFVVRLPLALGAGSRPAPARAKTETRMPQRILIVDDNRDSADTMCALLRALGVEARVAYDGRAALAALDAFRPGAVMLDLGMPEMDGYEVARRIRERSDLAGTALIALTGWGGVADRRRSGEAGFAHHLVKPVDLETMSAVLASLEG